VSSGELERLLASYAAAGRQVDAGLAVLSGEVERRSRREHGHTGLAQSSGDRTPDAFVARVTGTSGGAADGVLLCRHNHMLLHNGGWRITRPPGPGHTGWSMTDGRRDIPLVSKNPVRKRMIARTT
jgi:hypothetical protein